MSTNLFDRFTDFLACLSLNDLGPSFWAEDVADAAWHHEAVTS